MTNLEPYNLVSNKLSISRDMLIVTGIDTDLKNICEQTILAFAIEGFAFELMKYWT